jgi:RimJ/RimL family protein N-acetyltransferase
VGQGGLSYLQSGRLHLIPATETLARADLAGRAALSEMLEAEVPEDWPPAHHSRPVLEAVLAALRDRASRGWLTWYLVTREAAPRLVGVCSFEGRPDATGSVEISYALPAAFRSRGFATEAVERLVAWAFSHAQVREVRAETLPHHTASIRVLRKCGFRPAGAGSEHGVERFVLRREHLR